MFRRPWIVTAVSNDTNKPFMEDQGLLDSKYWLKSSAVRDMHWMNRVRRNLSVSQSWRYVLMNRDGEIVE